MNNPSIVFGKDSYKPILKEMWKICFPDDSDTFIDFYFEGVYKNEETLVYLENDVPVASLQMLPYAIKVGKVIQLSGYISGAMTHPDFRGRGYMEQLMKASFSVMQEKGFTSSFLIPQEKSLFDYYAQWGYEKAFPEQASMQIDPSNCIFKYNDETDSIILRDKNVCVFTQYEEVDVDDLYSTYYRFLMEKENVVLKNKEQLRQILWDLFNDQGVLFANDWGLAFVMPQKGEVIIKEFFYYDEEIRCEFLQNIAEYFPCKKLILQEINSLAIGQLKGMIKGLNESNPLIKDIYMSMMLD